MIPRLMLADGDLFSIQEARDFVRRSAAAQKVWHRADQAKVDRVCEAIVDAIRMKAAALGQLAFDETGFGDPPSKTRKNLFAAVSVWESIRDLKTVGVVKRDDEKRVYEIAEPYGVVLGIVPVTNPTSTAIFKILSAIKTRNSIVLSPHPRAARCIGECARVASEAAARAGASADLILCLPRPTLEGTEEAMKHRETALILATGGPGLVRAAYSSGKPAIGVGPGNAPCYVEGTADVEQAAEAIVQSQVFDNGTLCCSEQAIVVDAKVKAALIAGMKARDAWFCSAEERVKLGALVVKGRALNPAVVGLYPWQIAEMAGFAVPRATSVLVSEETGVGWDHPLSIEKLSPILAMYTVKDWKEGCERCIEVLDFGGRGHTLTIHSRNEEIVWEFALEKPTHRILVNTPASHGAIGESTWLDPSLTLGCGSFGGNITSDNITAKHLLLTKRLAFGKPGFVEKEARFRKSREVASAPLSKRPAPPSFHGSSAAFSMRQWPEPPRRP